MKKTELDEILKLHKMWLNNEEGGKRAYLKGADLRDADLRDADLRGADLSGADLKDAYLKGADLRDAYLRGANLSYADLRDAYLRGAYLRDAYLRGADLRDADLSDADLSCANLRGAYFRGAIKMPMHCKWYHGITNGMIHIGCEKRTIEDWDKFFASDEVITTERNTDEFKQIEAVYNAYKAYILTLNK